jgi:hypothetical protein
MGVCGLRLAAAHLSPAPELLLHTPRFQARRRSLSGCGWRWWHLPSGTASMNQGGLKQRVNRGLIGLE